MDHYKTESVFFLIKQVFSGVTADSTEFQIITNTLILKLKWS